MAAPSAGSRLQAARKRTGPPSDGKILQPSIGAPEICQACQELIRSIVIGGGINVNARVVGIAFILLAVSLPSSAINRFPLLAIMSRISSPLTSVAISGNRGPCRCSARATGSRA